MAHQTNTGPVEGRGWFGPLHQLLYVLELAGAEKNADGQFLIYGSICTGIGGYDTAVATNAECLINGQRTSVVGLMSVTSYGTRPIVISA